jgi:predicted O-linked N-acetylglucosamine transferase (SPINDLY family)
LIASSLEDYNQKAIDLARDALAGGSKLKDIRKKITENRMTSPLFDTARWVCFGIGLYFAKMFPFLLFFLFFRPNS